MKLKKIMAYVLVFAMLISSLQVSAIYVKAEGGEDAETIFSSVADEQMSGSCLGEQSFSEEIYVDDGYATGDAEDKNGQENIQVSLYASSNASSAKAISVNTPYTDALSTSSEEDWYEVSITAEGYISLSFQHEYIDSSSNYWNACIYDSNYEELVSYYYEGKTIAEVQGGNIGVPVGTYYIKVVASTTYRWSDVDYTLMLCYTPSAIWETEFNEEQGSADVIMANMAVNGSLRVSNDVDWYKVSLAEDGYISLSFKHGYVDSSSTYWKAYIYDSNYEELAGYSYEGKTIPEVQGGNIGVPAGTYYIKVEVSTTYRWSDVDYTLMLCYTPSAIWETEFNEEQGSADVIMANMAVNGSLRASNDVDWYKVSLAEDGYISLSFKHEYVDSSGNYWKASIYDSNYDELAGYSYEGKTIPEVQGGNIGVPAGTYYIKVIKSSYWSESNYTFTLNYTASTAWETEFNETQESADPITANMPVNGSLRTSNDVDWYKVSVAEDGYISLSFKHEYIDSSSNYWKASIYDSNYEELVGYSYAGKTIPEVQGRNIGVPAGTYYIKVIKSSYWSELNYTFTLNYTASTAWETEFNETQESADPITVNTAVKGNLRTSNDIDWYKVELSADETVSLFFIHDLIESSSNYWKASIYNSNLEELGKYEYKGNNITAVQGKEISVAAGTYYIKVTPYSSSYGYYSSANYMLMLGIAQTYKVSFDLQGHGEAINPVEVQEWARLTAPDEPVAEGYTFEGWYREAACENAWNFQADIVMEDITLYAKWIAEDKEDKPVTVYTVTYDMQGHGNQITPVKVNKGDRLNVPETPTAEGYRFGGWYKEAACINIWNFQSDIVNADLTLYACWIYSENDGQDLGDVLPEDLPASGIPEGIWVAGLKDYTYTGKNIKPEVRVYYNNKRLTKGQDYTVSYKNNKNAATYDSGKKAPSVIIKGKGNYAGTASQTFTIKQAVLTESENLVASKTYTKGESYMPAIQLSGMVLKANADYTLTYLDANLSELKKRPVEEGLYYIRVIGKKNCTGDFYFQYRIIKGGSINIAKGKATVGNMVYGGKSPVTSLIVNGSTLTSKDYKVIFSNVNAKGTGTATFIGIGNYTGVLKKSFKVTPLSIQEAKITVTGTGTYEKGGAKPKVSVVMNNTELTAGVDYTVSYRNHTKLGATASIVVKGKGNYCGNISKSFQVKSKALNESNMKIVVSDATAQKSPTVVIYDTNGKKLAQGSDYTIYVDTDAHRVEITGGSNGLYTGSITKKYNELEAEKIITSVKLNKKANNFPKYFKYTGSPVELDKSWLTVKTKNSILSSDDFEIIGYVNNVEKGTATAIIQGKNGYGGVKTLSFKIQSYGLTGIFNWFIPHPE